MFYLLAKRFLTLSALSILPTGLAQSAPSSISHVSLFLNSNTWPNAKLLTSSIKEDAINDGQPIWFEIMDIGPGEYQNISLFWPDGETIRFSVNAAQPEAGIAPGLLFVAEQSSTCTAVFEAFVGSLGLEYTFNGAQCW
ncbi:hypothetical protein GYMLUDRAFT_60489 [Collybiopsis luxurians FD-317 M1]|uniref:Uncharacterized protein n=1 Tax=Collybiopsis luxurians FD-317 M1 TaxID=944289 RepID=A0A0D0B5Q2_9AGAR|nr:hypothetical protein GYMLUDRAFT_60489 [Collybiopsis luxurians FD-317 M1]